MTGSFAPSLPHGTACPGPSVIPTTRPCLCDSEQSKLAILIDERRALAAQVAGKDVEISLALGDRDAARRALAEMKVQIEARHAVREAGCFDSMGERDAAAMKGGARG